MVNLSFAAGFVPAVTVAISLHSCQSSTLGLLACSILPESAGRRYGSTTCQFGVFRRQLAPSLQTGQRRAGGRRPRPISTYTAPIRSCLGLGGGHGLASH